MVTIKTANAPQDGQITVTANFNGCSSVTSVAIPVSVLPAIPAPPAFVDVANEFFHCGEWKFCDIGSLEVTKPSAEEIESYTWTISAPWYFTTPQGPAQSLTNNVNFSPQIVRSGNVTALLSVFATNCKGNSSATTITVVPEDPAWCPGTLWWVPYPLGCSCCQPGSGGNPQYKQGKLSHDFVVYPNPSAGNFVIQLPNHESSGILTLTDMSGKLVMKVPINNTLVDVNAKGVASGTYLLLITTPNASYTQLINISGYAAH